MKISVKTKNFNVNFPRNLFFTFILRKNEHVKFNSQKKIKHSINFTLPASLQENSMITLFVIMNPLNINLSGLDENIKP